MRFLTIFVCLNKKKKQTENNYFAFGIEETKRLRITQQLESTIKVLRGRCFSLTETKLKTK
ncbi:MAG: hypothetical protein DBW72_02745 [Flavobacteriales bacterium]|nr:MAG: hypothetical protein DBW72_02745 [Flavobacteriales bacterium]